MLKLSILLLRKRLCLHTMPVNSHPEYKSNEIDENNHICVMFYNLQYNLSIKLCFMDNSLWAKLLWTLQTVFNHRGDGLSFESGLDIKNSHDPSQNRSGYPVGPREMSWNLRSWTGFRRIFWDRAGPGESEEKGVKRPQSVLGIRKHCLVITSTKSDNRLCCKCQD